MQSISTITQRKYISSRMVVVRCNQKLCNSKNLFSKIKSGTHEFLNDASRKVVSIGLATCMAVAPASFSYADDDFKFPTSDNIEVQQAQLSLIESWALASDLFYDVAIPSEVWDEYLVDGLTEQYSAQTGEEAQKVVEAFLAKLNDPYTRIVPAEQFGQFLTTSDGELQGVGLMIVGDPDSGRLIVLSPVKGGPAQRAGIQAGDEKNATIQQVSLKREVIQVSPVSFTMLEQGRDNIGFVRLSNFGVNAARDIEYAITELKAQGAQAFILDLRSNPGGLVNSAMKVAQLWLEPGSTVVNVVDARLQQQLERGQLAAQQSNFTFPELAQAVSEAVVQPEIPGHLPTHQISLKSGLSVKEPLVVLVDEQSASASEILAGALQDNNRATVVGTKTYGKGKIQSVFPLSDGSGLFLTVAKYETPAFHEIDQIGVFPDKACGVTPFVNPQSFVDGEPGHLLEGSFQTIMDLDNDPCVLTAEKTLHQTIKQQQVTRLVAMNP